MSPTVVVNSPVSIAAPLGVGGGVRGNVGHRPSDRTELEPVAAANRGVMWRSSPLRDTGSPRDSGVASRRVRLRRSSDAATGNDDTRHVPRRAEHETCWTTA